jgi:toxic protein SymE
LECEFTVVLRPNGNGGLFNPAPRLILNGKWLAAAGFSTGQKVQVFVEQGRLVIELAVEE